MNRHYPLYRLGLLVLVALFLAGGWPAAQAAPVAPAQIAPLLPTLTDPLTVRINLGRDPFTLDPALTASSTSINVGSTEKSNHRDMENTEALENILENSLGPLCLSGYFSRLNVGTQLFVGLTSLDDRTGTVVPELATAWEISSDSSVYTFTLRSDAFWSDGQPLTAYDVEYGVRRSVRPETGADYAYVLYVIQNAYTINNTPPTETYDIETLGVHALDARTIRFDLEQPATYLPAIVSTWVAFPQPQWAIEEWGEQWTEAEHIVSSGPYLLEEWVHDDHITLVNNPTFYGAGRVQIEQVEYAMVADSWTALAMYENGELDTVLVPSDELERIRTDPVLSQELHVGTTLCTYYYGFTASKPPLDDARVRQALSASIDRTALIDNVLGGVQIPANAFTPPGLFGNAAGEADVGVTYDPNLARELTWTLLPNGGVKTLLAWFADQAGNVSPPARASTNYLPERAEIDAKEWDLYRWPLTAGHGLSLTLHVATLSGDADLYVWQPGNSGPPDWFSDASGQTTEELTFTAPVSGVYQVQVYGYGETKYHLAVAPLTQVGTWAERAMIQQKEVPSLPLSMFNPADPDIPVGGPPPPVDLLPPLLVTVRPASGSVPHSGAEIALGFSEPMSPTSLLHTCQPDPGGWSTEWRRGDREVVLRHNVFQSGETYTITVNGADLTGNPLAGGAYTWSFEVGMPIFLPLVLRSRN